MANLDASTRSGFEVQPPSPVPPARQPVVAGGAACNTTLIMIGVGVLLIAAGGGGVAYAMSSKGGSDTTPTPPPTAAPTAPPAPTAAPTLATTTTTTQDPARWACKSNFNFPAGVKMNKKGMCLDDDTFRGCPDKITALWPNTEDEKIAAFRMFKSWTPAWGDDEKKRKAWANIKAMVEANDAKIMIGVEVTCDDEHDMAEWQKTREFIKYVGKERFMAVAVGNEMELYYTQNVNVSCTMACKDPQKTQCMETSLWSKTSPTSYASKIARIVKDLEADGVTDAKLTAVFGGYAKVSYPFHVGVEYVLKNASDSYGDRFVYGFNEYPFWQGIEGNWCGSYQYGDWKGISGVFNDYYNRVKQSTQMTGDPELWMTETGWSSGLPSGGRPAPTCPDDGELGKFCSVQREKGYYNAFRNWDMGKTSWAFYFTVRDSANFQMTEAFGLVNACDDTSDKCKIQDESHPTKNTCEKLGCGNHDETCWCTDTCEAHHSCCDDYKDKCGSNPKTKSTCATLGCNKRDSTCACTAECKLYDSCCDDYDTQCAAEKSTCEKLGCGNHDATCWCTPSCISHNSCCDDYQTKCGSSPMFVRQNITAII